MKKNLLVTSLLFMLFFTLLLVPTVSLADDNRDANEQDFVGKYTCGNTTACKNGDNNCGITFHKNLPNFTSTLYDVIKIVTPVIVIITGMLDVLKSVTAQKEDEMKKAQKKFLNRLLAGAVVFLVFIIVEFVLTLIVPKDSTNAMGCVNCFINGAKKCNTVK